MRNYFLSQFLRERSRLSPHGRDRTERLNLSGQRGGRFRAAPFLLLLALSGCAFNPTQNLKSKNLNPENQNQILLSLNHWSAEGAVNIFIPNQAAQHINFIWTQSNQNSKIELYGPLGLDPVRITQTPSKIILETADHQIYQSNNAENLMDNLLGWSVPLDNMKYWLLGLNNIASPLAGETAQEAAGSLGREGESTSPWTITYPAYSQITYSQKNILNLPSKIILIKAPSLSHQDPAPQNQNQTPPLQNLSQLIQDQQAQQIQEQKMTVIVLVHHWTLAEN